MHLQSLLNNPGYIAKTTAVSAVTNCWSKVLINKSIQTASKAFDIYVIRDVR